MRLTQWAKMKVRMRTTTLLLALLASVALLVGDRALHEYFELRSSNEALRTQVSEADTYVRENKGKIDALLNTIKRQDKSIRGLEDATDEYGKKIFEMELAKQIVGFITKADPAKSCFKVNVVDVQGYIHNCIKYEKIYGKKYPVYAGNFSWRAMMKVLYIENQYERNPPKGKATELGCPQIREFVYEKNRKGKVIRIPQLYNVLVRLGHKRASYETTINAYRQSTEIQVDCLYYFFYLKLKDCDGDFIHALVAYNSARQFPEVSVYWLKYQNATSLLNGWVEKAKGKMK